MVALPGQLFYSTQIPVCLWFLTKSKAARTRKLASGETEKLRARKSETLFIDARKLGSLVDRVHRELTDADIDKIVHAYHSWRIDLPMGEIRDGDLISLVDPDPAWIYRDIPGFCRSVGTAEIAEHGYVLTPGRYVGAEEVVDEGEPFEEKMPRLVAELNAQFEESAKLEAAIKANLRGLGYDG
jgi:type I restriction enzyme M protein